MTMESLQQRKTRARTIIRRLSASYPGAQTALLHDDPLQLLVATILSAQCTDERVNKVTPALFRRYRGAAEFASASRPELESIIRSTGFYRAKANSILRCCAEISSRHGGKVPSTMEELVSLSGVGRKTANVVLGSAFGKAEGVVVDTHVKRISGLLRLSAAGTPEKIEEDLMEVLAEKDWILFPHLLILHGRKVCKARKPLCAECVISGFCPSSKA
jgi:endonuclease-3